VVLPVTFGTHDNYLTENVTFDIAKISLAYNGLLGRLDVAQFMVATHYVYNMIKIPATWGVLTIQMDIRDAIFCVTEMDKVAVAGEPDNFGEAMLEDADPGPSSARKRFSPEPVVMVCEGIGPAPREGKLVGEAELTKKVPLGDGTSRTFTNGSPLTPK
jgi:hypothetical protein